jgi:hypothetical protein
MSGKGYIALRRDGVLSPTATVLGTSIRISPGTGTGTNQVAQSTPGLTTDQTIQSNDSTLLTVRRNAIRRPSLGKSSSFATTVSNRAITHPTVPSGRTKQSDSLRLKSRPLSKPILGLVHPEALALGQRTLVRPPGSLRHQAALILTTL